MKRKIEIFATLFMLALAIGLTAFYGRSSAAKATVLELRIANAVDVFKQEPMPVTVTKVTQGGKPLKFSEAFTATTDALSNATVSVRNVSNKEIKALSLVFYLVDPITERPKAMSSSVRFKEAIAAGATAEGTIDSALVGQLQRLSQHVELPLTQLRLGIDWAEFSDSTRWMSGRILARDTAQAGKWYVQGSNQAFQETPGPRLQGEKAVFSKVSTSALWCECCQLAGTLMIGCQRPNAEGCPGTVENQNFAGGPDYPGYDNFDTVAVECSTNCFQYPFRVVSHCP